MIGIKGHDPKKMAKALKNIVDENRSSMSKGFTAITPHMYGVSEPMPSREVSYPELRLSIKDIPAAKGWKVGNRYSMELIVEQTELSDRIGTEAKVSFSIIGIKAGQEVEKPDKVKKLEDKAENGSADKENEESDEY